MKKFENIWNVIARSGDNCDMGGVGNVIIGRVRRTDNLSLIKKEAAEILGSCVASPRMTDEKEVAGILGSCVASPRMTVEKKCPRMTDEKGYCHLEPRAIARGCKDLINKCRDCIELTRLKQVRIKLKRDLYGDFACAQPLKMTMIICLVLSLGITSESQAVTTCAWEKDADGTDTTKLVVSGSGAMSSTSNCPSGWRDTATEIEIEKGVTAISYWGNGFQNATKVTKVTIPDTVTSIGDGAFSNMSSVTSLTIPNSVTSIGGWAFTGMSGVTGELKIPEGVTSIGSYAFQGMSGVTGELKIPEGVTRIADSAFSGMSGVTSLVIPEGVTKTGANAFRGMSGVTGELKIPNSVTSIGQSAFQGMSGITGELKIPEGVTSIGNWAFLGMSGVTGELKIPEGVTTIGDSAFSGMSGVTGALVIPEGVTTIGDGAFSGMSGVTSLVIPEGVTKIGGNAFRGMSGVTGELKIPEGVTSIGQSAFLDMSGVTGELKIPEGVTTIGNWAFLGMSGLTSLTIPDSVTSVGDSVFVGGKEVLIPDTLVVTDDWNDRAFNKDVNIRCLGDLDKCINALKKYLPESQGGGCTITNYCLNINKIVPATKEQCGGGMYTWNETTEKCNRLSEFQCNDYRDKNNKRKYYYNGNTCTKLPKDGKIACANACYKINDGYCDRVCYTPAEAAEIAKDSGNVVTLTFRK